MLSDKAREYGRSLLPSPHMVSGAKHERLVSKWFKKLPTMLLGKIWHQTHGGYQGSGLAWAAILLWKWSLKENWVEHWKSSSDFFFCGGSNSMGWHLCLKLVVRRAEWGEARGWRWEAEKESEEKFYWGRVCWVYGRESLPSFPFGFERAGESLIRCRSKEFTHGDLNN